MKLIDELTKLGVELTDEQKNSVTKKFGDEVVTAFEHEKKLAKAETEVENLKAELKLANDTVAKFEGIDPEKVSAEIENYKKEIETVKAEAKSALEARDFEDALKAELAGIKFTSESAKKTVLNELKNSGMKVKDGKLMGFSDYLESVKASDPSAFVNEEQQKLEESKAKFTTPIGTQGGSKSLTKADIRKIKDKDERQRAIAENIALYQ